MAARICLHGNFLVLVLTLGIVGCASTKDSSLNLQEWKRGNTLWKASSGHLVVLYTRPTHISPDPQAVVCESNTTRTLLVLSPDTFPLVSKQTLNIFQTKDRNTPGWYRLEHTHGLNWWERNVYTAKSLGGWQWVSDQTSLPTPPEEQSRNALLMMDEGKFRKIAEESSTKDLFSVPVDGFIYVGEPGLGVVKSVDLLSACP